MKYNEMKIMVKECISIQKELKGLRKPKNFNLDKLKELRKRAEATDFIKIIDSYSINIGYLSFYYGKKLRQLHIAYSLLKGKTYEQIEKPSEEKELGASDWSYINDLKKKLETKFNSNEL